MYSAPDLIIDNAPRRGRGKSGVPIINPATEEALGTISFANGEDVADAIVSAQKGFEAWRKVSSWERSNILLRIAGLIRERKSEIARLITLEVGKPLLEAELETQSGVEHFEWAAAAARQLHGNSISVRAPDGRGQSTYEPVGIALALTAWNFPINLSTRKVCMALAAGCACILRPSSEAPASVAAMVQCCVDAGLPEGVVTLLFGTPDEVIAPLMAEPSIRKVSFTGSTPVGQLLIRQGAETIKRMTMELGGHAPVIVLEDADVEEAAKIAGTAKFRNAGQVCTSPSRFYVHESVAEQFSKTMLEVAKNLKIGDGLDPSVTMGPMATERQRNHAEALVADARDHGGNIAYGGGRPTGFNKGYYFEPTVITDLDPSSKILTEEPFAPLAPIISFSKVEDALTAANSHEAGLAGYLFTRSLKNANLFSEELQVGVLGVNTCAVAMPEAPFGGIKQSGYGREGGVTAIYDYLNIKFTHTRLI